jgi:hypothetical protein
MSRVPRAVTPEQYWEKFAELLRAGLLTLGPQWKKTYEGCPSWTAYMVNSWDAILIRVGNALGYEDCRTRNSGRIDVCYFDADGILCVAIEHEHEAWERELSKLVSIPDGPLRVLVIYDRGKAPEVESRLARAIQTCCLPELLEVNSNSLLVIVGPWFKSYIEGTGLADYVAYKFLDGHFVALPAVRILPR